MPNRCLAGLLVLLFLSCQTAESQNPFTGRFTGEVNGDPVVLDLEPAGPGLVKGQLRDSQQSYLVQGNTEGPNISGKATEQTYGLTLQFRGKVEGNRLSLTMAIEGLGPETFQVDLLRDGTAAAAPGQPASGQASSKVKPDGLQRDPAVTGSWVHEEVYNSGYGDNFMGSMISSEITFAADGRLIEGNSSATMSGSDYHGESGGQGGGALEGIRWFTRDQAIWLIVTRDGQTQEVRLGRYAFGGGAMRITADNGEKLLLRRK